MKREIKFRAWDKRFKKMDFGAGDLLLRINEIDFSEPMQFTGLLDKNGKEIWEGDVVDFFACKWTIGWYALGAKFTLFTTTPRKNDTYHASAGVPIRDFNWIDSGKGGYKQDLKKVMPIEVIGNIYENPELLTPQL